MELDEINPEDWWPDAERRLDRFFMWKKLRLGFLGLGALAVTALVYWLSGSASSPLPFGSPLLDPVAVLKQAPAAPSVTQYNSDATGNVEAAGRTRPSISPEVKAGELLSTHQPSAVGHETKEVNHLRNNTQKGKGIKRFQESRTRNLDFRFNSAASEQEPSMQRARMAVAKAKPAEPKVVQTSPMLLPQALRVESPFGATPSAERNALAFFRMQPMGYFIPEGYVSDEQPVGAVNERGSTISYVESALPASKWRRFLSLQAGGMFITKTLISSGSEYRARRIDEERRVWKPVASVNLLFKRGNWGFSTGIDYAEYGERTTYQPWKYGFERFEDHRWDHHLVPQTNTVITYYQGNPYAQEITSYHPDSSLVIHQEVRQTKQMDSTMVQNWQQTQFAYVEIPLMVEYGLTFGKWETGVQAGGAFGWNTKREGRYINTNQTGLEDLSKVDYITPWNMSARAGLRFGYALTPNMSITLNPQWRTQFVSVLSPDHGAAQRYSAWGVMAGVRFNW